MTDLFFKIVNLSINASWLVAAVVLLRLILKKAPKWVWPVLWGLVALRLILPVSIESRVSMIPDPEPVSREAIVAYAPPLALETPVDRQINTVNAAQGNPVEVETELGPDDYLTMVWLGGAGLMVLYTFLSYVNLRRRVGRARKLQKKIFESQNVASPFVLGLFRPRIYLPLGLREDDRFYILAHEEAHIRRLDHIWKPLGFALLAVHWFNPFMWLAYILLCRDIELACDEKVIKALGREGRADYSQALLSCAIRHRSIAACPLAFGEVGVKQRVKSVLNYKKPTFWVILTALAASAAVAVCFLTDPKTAENGRLTLDTVRELTEKGEITPEDLEGYETEHKTGEDAYYCSVDEDYTLQYFIIDGGLHFPQLRCNTDFHGVYLHEPESPENLEKFLAVHDQPLMEGLETHMTIVLNLGATTPTGTNLYIYGQGELQNLEFTCEEDYTLRKQDWRGNWMELPQLTPPTEEEKMSDPTVQYQQTVDWTEKYGILPDGEYKLTKLIDYNFVGVSTGSYVEATFTVRTEGRPQLTAEEFLKRKKFEDESFYSKIQTREEYNAEHRNSWADYEDFACVEVNSEPISGWRSRCYQLDNGLIMSMNGDKTHERPNNILVSNGIYEELIMTDWVDSKEALAYALDLIVQPLVPGTQDHMGVKLIVDSYSPTGAEVSVVGTLPEYVTISPERDCWLQKLDEWGRWMTVKNLEGDTGHTQYWGVPFITKTLNWTEEYGALPAGTYRMNFETGVNYENGEEKSGFGMINWGLNATFTIGESQAETLAAQAQPFAPQEVHDLTQAVLCLRDAEYVVTSEEDLHYLETLLSQAKPEKGIPGCPFSSTTYLTRADGTVLSFRHAEDSCTALEVGTDYYSYDLGLGRDFWDTFGIAQYYVEATYDDQRRVIQLDEYEWGRRVPNSTTKFTYDHAGNLYIEERVNDDGTTIQKRIYGYDDRGNQVEWWNYDGDTLWSRGEREFDENNNLVKETGYRNDMLYLGTDYVYDENGRLLEEVHTLEGEPVSTVRYDWQDDHHYRVYHYTPEGELTHSTGYVLDDLGRMIRREGFSKYGGSEGYEEYEYVEGNDDRMIVRYYDKYGKMTEEGWANID